MGHQLNLFGGFMQEASIIAAVPDENTPPEADHAAKKRGRPRKERNPEAPPMLPVPSHADKPSMRATVELHQVHFNGSVFVGGNQATVLTRGKNNVEEMHLILSSGLVCIVFGASASNRAATVYLPPYRWAQVQERER
jgi:hypothetical protein